MHRSPDPEVFIYTWWERFLNAQSAAFGGDREFTELSNKLDEVRAALFADRELTAAELDLLNAKMEAVASIYAKLAALKGIPDDGSVRPSRESFRVYGEAAEIHFQTLCGRAEAYYRGGLLKKLLDAEDPDPWTHTIALDLLSSATGAIAMDKVGLIRAQVSLMGDGPRQRAILDRIRDHLAAELDRPLWKRSGPGPAMRADEFDRASRFDSVVSVRRLPIPSEVAGTNHLLPNRPLPGWAAANRRAIRALLADLRSAGRLFLDRVPGSDAPSNVAVKIELNLGIEGPPSVTDPAVTYAVLAELLEQAAGRGVRLQFTVGDSNGIENAPVGRTSMEVMRDTGNYHAALKAALEFASQKAGADDARRRAQEALAALLALEVGSPAVFLGSSDDRSSSAQDLAAIEAAASPWVACVDYDRTGFRTVDPGFGPLARAVWGSGRFHVAEPWVAADYRVHITRGTSTHLFAGWTGAVKGLIGLHALGGRPADLGMRQRGVSPLEVLGAVMQAGGFTGVLATRAGIPDFPALAARCEDAVCRSAVERSEHSWDALSGLAAGRRIWTAGAAELLAELRREQAAGAAETELMAKMRRRTAGLLAECERAAPGFRSSLWRGVADGTRAFLLTMWRLRDHVPREMRDEAIGLRIGLLSRLPYHADLVVQGLPKIGLGGGPDAYLEARDAGIVVAGTDEITVDLAALRAAGVPGNPWAYHHPVHGALQFGRGPMCWEEIRWLAGASPHPA